MCSLYSPELAVFLRTLARHSSVLAWRIPCTEEPGGLWSTGRSGSGTTEHTHASPTGAPRSGRERKARTDALLGTCPAHRPLMMKPQGAGPLAAGAQRGSAEPASHVPGARLRGGERAPPARSSEAGVWGTRVRQELNRLSDGFSLNRRSWRLE